MRLPILGNWHKRLTSPPSIACAICATGTFNAFNAARQLNAERINGAFVECGVWLGGCSAVMTDVVRQGTVPRKVWLFDSFEGLPRPSEEDGAQANKLIDGPLDGELVSTEKLVAPLEQVEAFFFDEMQFERALVEIRKGWFQDTLAINRGNIGPIAILRIDGDWYESTRCCLESLYKNVVPGGYVIIDDYWSVVGCKKAVDEFIDRRGLKVTLHFDARGGCYFTKPESGPS